MARTKSIPHRYVAPKRRLSTNPKKRLTTKRSADKDNKSSKGGTPQETPDIKKDSEPKQKKEKESS